MSGIHYFPRYSQKENAVTNNTLLLLLRLNEYNRLKFDRFIRSLAADIELEFPSTGLRFQQQKSTGKSVVDGHISQESLKIAIETKLGDTFDVDQMKRHLKVFRDEAHKMLILLRRSDPARTRESYSHFLALAREQGVSVVDTTFERLIDASRSCLSINDEQMMALVDDFEGFCSDENLLPRDEYAMFVPPCGISFEDNVACRLYYCPAAWSRRKTGFLGLYRDKSVQYVGRISKIVECLLLEDGSVESLREALTDEERVRIRSAIERARSRGWDLREGYRFFLCDELAATDFRKDSQGGIQGHRYFDLKRVLGRPIPEGLPAIAERLRTASWLP